MRLLFCEFGGLGEFAIEESFQKLGYEVDVFVSQTKNYDYDKSFLKSFSQKMEDQSYDLVFSINFLPIISKICQIFRTKYISWVYDCPELHLYSKAIQNDVNRIFIFDRVQYEKFSRKSPETVFYMPLATKPMTKLDMEEITLKQRKEYEHDICFIGSLYDEKDKRFHELHQLPEYWRGYIDGLVRAQINVYGYNFIADALSQEAVRELKKYLKFVLVDDYEADDRDMISDMYIGTMVSAYERENVVYTLSQKHKLTLYTGSDTSRFKNVDNRGFADSVSMMPKIFHCSKINLNITSKTIQSGIPLRVFDVLGSKGFLITNYQPELLNYFEPDIDLVVYDSIEDLQQKVDYYLLHEDERERIAQNGYKKVCEFFTYDKMVSEILEMSGIELK